MAVKGEQLHLQTESYRVLRVDPRTNGITQITITSARGSFTVPESLWEEAHYAQELEARVEALEARIAELETCVKLAV